MFRANPKHPGAAHYLIHVSDLDASFAARALPAARAYAKIAPDAEHALHMPSHVFLKLGMWDDVASSNERAWAASRAWVKRGGLSNTDLDFHGFAWLQYAYLQQGRWRAALSLVDSVRAVLAGVETAGVGSVDAHYALPMLQLAYATETGRWDEAPADRPASAPVGPASSADRERNFMALTSFRWALGAAMRGDTAAAGALRALGGVPDSAQAAERPMVALRALVLAALSARAGGDTTQAIALLRRAAPIDDRIPAVGPPPAIPVRELLGDMLLRSGQPREAAAEYERALAHLPNRSAALLGLARARRASGDSAGAADAYRRLLANWRLADRDLPALAEARAGAARARPAPAADPTIDIALLPLPEQLRRGARVVSFDASGRVVELRRGANGTVFARFSRARRSSTPTATTSRS